MKFILSSNFSKSHFPSLLDRQIYIFFEKVLDSPHRKLSEEHFRVDDIFF